ncbi:hypothetical protein FRB90_009289 [Tulasnella sp. 427]|nr:hypothetical protein FRB90_009289 [Tulasnella sp. 427]
MESPIPSSNEAPVANDMIRLNFSRNSVFNTVISSEDNEIIYQVSTPNTKSIGNKMTSIWRMDKELQQRVFVAEVAWKFLTGKAQVKMGWEACDWMLVKKWLANSKGISSVKTFTTKQGVKYRWKLRKLQFHMTVDEAGSEGRSPSLAIFHAPLVKGFGPAYLEVSAGVLRDLDCIMVALIIMEKFRRDD